MGRYFDFDQQHNLYGDPFGCPCCSAALPELARVSGINLTEHAQRYRRPPPRPLRDRPLVMINARIQTMNPAQPTAEALVIDNGRIQWVGSAAQAAAQAGTGAQIIDCAGRSLLPGFIEPHMHLLPIAMLTAFENIGPFRFPTVHGALQRLREVAADTPPGEWILGRQFDPSLQDGADTLTAAMLDTVSTSQPVFVYNASLHFAYCNTRALQLAGITADTPDPPGSPFGRNADGSPNGVLAGGVSMGMVARHNSAVRGRNLVDSCVQVLKHANAVGFTTVVDQGTGGFQGARELDAYRELRASGAMTARLRYSLINNQADKWDSTDIHCGDGDAWLRASAWKIVSDGSNQGRTGLQREPFLNDTGRGLAYIEPDALNAAVARRLADGWQVAVHANGDAAIDRVLDAFEAAAAQGLDVRSARCRIEHCSILHDEHIERIAHLGLSPSFLIGHVHYWGKAFRDDIFGLHKAEKLDRTAACEAAGIRWTLHSDEPVTEMNPLRCIDNAVNRSMWKAPGEVLAAAERIPVAAALRAMTIDAAWQCHSEHEIGSLEAGKLADFVVLDADPLGVDAAAIGTIGVLETWVNGEQVFAR